MNLKIDTEKFPFLPKDIFRKDISKKIFLRDVSEQDEPRHGDTSQGVRLRPRQNKGVACSAFGSIQQRGMHSF